MQTRRSQPILSPITEAAIFLVLTVEAGAEQAARDVLTDVSAVKRTVGFRIPEAELTCVVGIGADCWDRLYGTPRPAELHQLAAVAGSRHAAVSTPGDLLFHIRAHRFDLCFEFVQRLADRFGAAARVLDEVHAFRSFDERDLLGFVDGDREPRRHRRGRCRTDRDRGSRFRGRQLRGRPEVPARPRRVERSTPVQEQELAIGRTKLDDVELPDELKPANSHVALNTILDEQGRQREIVRVNMPFGKVSDAEFGTYFIGCARTPEVIEQMLRNMLVGKPPDNYDRILDFSKAVTGTLFYVPTASFLDDPDTLAPAPDRDDELGVGNDDGSLGLGSLKSEP